MDHANFERVGRKCEAVHGISPDLNTRLEADIEPLEDVCQAQKYQGLAQFLSETSSLADLSRGKIALYYPLIITVPVNSHLERKYFVFLAEFSLGVKEPGWLEDVRLVPDFGVRVDGPVERHHHGAGLQLPPPSNLHGGDHTVRYSLRCHRPQSLHF